MRSLVERRLRQEAMQISFSQRKDLKIVKSLENSPPEEKICVAVGNDLVESVSALRWALKWAAYTRSLILLLIQLPIRFIPSPLGEIPVSQVSNDILNVHKENEEKNLRECMEFYLEMCSQARVKAEALIVEKADVSKGIVEVVSEEGFTKLIIGTSSSRAISKKMKIQGPGKADYVLRHAIESCEVSIICNGKLLQLREASPLHKVAGQKPLNFRIPLKDLLGERLQNATFSSSSVHGRLSVSFNQNVEGNSKNASSFSSVSSEEWNTGGYEVSSFHQLYSALEEERRKRIMGEEGCGDTQTKSEGCGNSLSIFFREGSQLRSLLKSLTEIINTGWRNKNRRHNVLLSYSNKEGILK